MREERRRRETKIGKERGRGEDILFLAAPLCTSQKPVSSCPRSPRSTKETDSFREGFLREEEIHMQITKTHARLCRGIVGKERAREDRCAYRALENSLGHISSSTPFPSKIYDKSKNKANS